MKQNTSDPRNACPEAVVLSRYLESELASDPQRAATERDSIERHLEDCPRCRDELRELKSARALLRATPREAAPPTLVADVLRALPEPAPAADEAPLVSETLASSEDPSTIAAGSTLRLVLAAAALLLLTTGFAYVAARLGAGRGVGLGAGHSALTDPDGLARDRLPGEREESETALAVARELRLRVSELERERDRARNEAREAERGRQDLNATNAEREQALEARIDELARTLATNRRESERRLTESAQQLELAQASLRSLKAEQSASLARFERERREAQRSLRRTEATLAELTKERAESEAGRSEALAELARLQVEIEKLRGAMVARGDPRSVSPAVERSPSRPRRAHRASRPRDVRVAFVRSRGRLELAASGPVDELVPALLREARESPGERARLALGRAEDLMSRLEATRGGDRNAPPPRSPGLLTRLSRHVALASGLSDADESATASTLSDRLEAAELAWQRLARP